ncbi:hypothetical protein [Cellulophaga sp. BC115SP]|uniref:hypothetical protein n=1 Tax=Cellulophaga sp. BC115SP TaxID=2683263 RepID=UPI0014135D84|nr:hypothetical protein [Cellulophaga sp. BC115SP]NBB32037.1 hypothetical protein [Cellulophaga sp. BC115SP]
MFHLLDNQANIAGFKIFNNTILICDKNNIAYYNDVPITNDVDGTRIFCHSNFVFLPSYSGNKTYLFFNNQVKEIPFVLWLHTIEKNNVVGYDYIPTRKAFKIFIYDSLNSFVITRLFKELPIWDLIRKNDFIYFFEKRKITLFSFSLLTGEYEWEVDLGAYGEIDKIIGVCNDILWIGVGSKMLIGIDIKYGKIIHIIDKPSHFAYQSGAFNYFRGHDGQIDEKAKKIVGFEL